MSAAAISRPRRVGRILPATGLVVLTLAALIGGQFAVPANAAPSASPTIAVLDFELNDLTLDPGTAEERERTASVAPMLRETLRSRHGFRVVAVDSETQAAADKAAGYLFEHADVAAELGRDAGSDWIVVGRVHKASFLFVYFMAQVIDTATSRRIAELKVEVKGTQERLTQKGVDALAEQIRAAIDAAT